MLFCSFLFVRHADLFSVFLAFPAAGEIIYCVAFRFVTGQYDNRIKNLSFIF